MRLNQIDFAKGILIILMVLFHLEAFTRLYPSLSSWVCSFHMPVFLIISGFFFNYRKDLKGFSKSLRTLLVPFIVFEIIYILSLVLVGDILGSRTLDRISVNSVGDFITLVLFKPRGTYWYLHTLSICMIAVYLVNKLFKFQNNINTIIVSSSILCLLPLTGCGVHWENIQYFILGMVLRNYNIDIADNKYSSILSIIPITLVTFFSLTYVRSGLSGMSLSIFILSFLVALFYYAPKFIQNLFVFLGKNSLSIVLFSPFTLTALRYVIKPFSFDSTNILYSICVVSLAIGTCIVSAIAFDRLKISQLVVGKNLYNKL